VVKAGDPYQFQCERTAAAIVAKLGIPDLDWLVCYQSRVGPMKWIGPSTDEAIRKAANDKMPVVVAPIAFVSEHSETLVEIEIEYRKLASDVGVPYFVRVPTVDAAQPFIAELAALVNRLAAAPEIGLRCGRRASNLSPAPHRLPDPIRRRILASAYLWIKALHVIAVIAWMAGLLYLPRLFVYHSKARLGSSSSETFKMMEEKLVRIIMTPAMVVAWICGLAMIGLNPELLRSGWWLWVKLLFVVGLTVIHFMMNGWRRDFASDNNHRSEKFFRIANELPTLAMIVIVVMVIVRPFNPVWV